MFSLNIGGIFAGVGTALGGFFTFLGPILAKIMDWSEQFLKAFFSGLSIIFSNISTFVVIVPLLIAVSLYTMRLDNNRVIEPYKKDISELEKAYNKVPKQYRTLKKNSAGHYYRPRVITTPSWKPFSSEGGN